MVLLRRNGVNDVDDVEEDEEDDDEDDDDDEDGDDDDVDESLAGRLFVDVDDILFKLGMGKPLYGNFVISVFVFLYSITGKSVVKSVVVSLKQSFFVHRAMFS